jgi:hypothetical protein
MGDNLLHPLHIDIYSLYVSDVNVSHVFTAVGINMTFIGKSICV